MFSFGFIFFTLNRSHKTLSLDVVINTTVNILLTMELLLYAWDTYVVIQYSPITAKNLSFLISNALMQHRLKNNGTTWHHIFIRYIDSFR